MPAPSLDERKRAHASTPFYAVTPFTMLDFPGRTACIVWLAGCNMRCGYCHNPQIVLGKGTISTDAVLAFLQRRRGLLYGMVLSGGEATAWPGLIDFAARVKAWGFAIKLDTNGLRPDVVEHLLGRGLVDYIALDYKAPQHRFAAVTGTTAYRRFSRTLDLLCAQNAVPFEARTTIHDALMDEADIITIASDLHRRGYRGDYALQPAITGRDRPTLGALPPQMKEWDLARLQARSPVKLQIRQP